jgi:peptidyl-prolyl cis-trans isomerase SurA
MKKYFFLIIIFVSKIALAQTIISYGNYTVSKDEFLRAYNKNKTPVEDKKKAIREYAELYTNFKLKVRAAQDLRIDTLNQIKNDVENFRHQVEENYLNDETTFKVLLNEALRRSQQDLRVFHYSIQIDPNDKSEDTLQKYQTIFSFYNNLKNGAPNLKIPEGIKASDLGYITVFSLPYQY